MKDYRALFRSVFEMGKEQDAGVLFENLIQKAFPTFSFRGLELTEFDRIAQTFAGKSWNHVFDVKKASLDGCDVWEVNCHRVSAGKTPDKQVYLEYMTLDFVKYKEIE